MLPAQIGPIEAFAEAVRHHGPGSALRLWVVSKSRQRKGIDGRICKRVTDAAKEMKLPVGAGRGHFRREIVGVGFATRGSAAPTSMRIFAEIARRRFQKVE